MMRYHIVFRFVTMAHSEAKDLRRRDTPNLFTRAVSGLKDDIKVLYMASAEGDYVQADCFSSSRSLCTSFSRRKGLIPKLCIQLAMFAYFRSMQTYIPSRVTILYVPALD